MHTRGSATDTDCNERRYEVEEESWEYQVDIETDKDFTGKHYLKPNEVENFSVLFGRKHGGPTLTVYRVDLDLVFDEDIPPLRIPDVRVKMIGPSVVKGAFSPGVTEARWSACMLDNIRSFDAVGYDYRKNISPKSLALIEKYK